MNSNKLSKTAFTLIELLVVIAIIGILSGLIIVGMSSTTQSATIAKAQVFSASLKDSLLINLMSEWKFDGPTAAESAATLNDSLDNWGSNNVTTISATVKGGADCIYGKCLRFNGTTNYAEIFDNPSLRMVNVDFSVESWIYPESTAVSFQGLICKGTANSSGWNIVYNSSPQAVGLWLSNGTPVNYNANSNSAPINKWTHFVLSYFYNNGSPYIKWYINGVHQRTDNAINISSGTIPLHLGWTASGWNYYYTGKMDNVRIYSAAIPASQIKEQYYAGLNHLLAKGGINKEEYLNGIK